MRKKISRALLIGYLGIYLSFSPLLTYVMADETSESTPSASIENPTPTESVSNPTPTPTQTQEASLENTNNYDNTATPSGQIVTAGPQETGAQEIRNSENIETETIENNNTADALTEKNQDTTTGANYVSGLPDAPASVLTGDAKSVENLATIVNANITGQQIVPVVLNYFEAHTGDINLTSIMPCTSSAEPTQPTEPLTIVNTGDESVFKVVSETLVNKEIISSNEATINNNITVSAVSGNNTLEGSDGTIDTGDAAAIANVFNLANLNLTGNCGFFGIINLFGPQIGNILLPYELGFITSEQSLSSEGGSNSITNSGNENNFFLNMLRLRDLLISNTNSANVDTTINASANTGFNYLDGGLRVDTGDASTIVNILDLLNMNIFGNGWMWVRVNHFKSGRQEITDIYDYVSAYPYGAFPYSGQNSISNTGDTSQFELTQTDAIKTVIDNTNNATVTNTINVTADTGNNKSFGNSNIVSTGNALSKVNLFNFINTNIIGRNWYFTVINIFDDFAGDIFFPRPDLAVSLSADRRDLYGQDAITYTLNYENRGNLWAQDVTLSSMLSPFVNLVNASGNPSNNSNMLSWKLGNLPVGARGTFSITVKVNDGTASDQWVFNKLSIVTKTDEPQKSNNATELANFYRRSYPASPSVGGASSQSSPTFSNSQSSPQSQVLGFSQSSKKIIKKTISKKKIAKKSLKKTTKKPVKANKKMLKSKKTNGIFKKTNKVIKKTFSIPKKVSQKIHEFLTQYIASLSTGSS